MVIEGTPLVTVCYDLRNERCVDERARYHAGDWTYLRTLLHEGSQLNLIRPRIVGEVYEPELIVFEPDYLVDVTSIAACCQSYAHSPLLHLLNKLKPNAITVPILLGNLAGQALDEQLLDTSSMQGNEEVNFPLNEVYLRLIKDFFARNSVALATCEGLGAGFHEKGRRQLTHIRQALTRQLTEVPVFEREKTVVEPSFYCEQLGISGRMDMLQADYRVLVEQKSGRSAFPENPEHPRPQAHHLMQVLLYMAVLHYAHGLPADQIHAFLLYSKYPLGLVRTGPSPALLFEAFRLRNQLVAMEFRYASQHGLDFLLTLTPDYFRQENVSSKLWRWIEPELAALLSPLQRASDLERAYFLRFFRFLANEHLLSKLGNGTDGCPGFAAAWHASYEEKQQTGNIMAGMRLIPEMEGEGTAVECVRLEQEASGGSMTMEVVNFRRGDIVLFYSYRLGTEPDLRSTIVYRASIQEVLEHGVKLRLRAPQRHLFVFETDDKSRWAMEHDFMEASYTSLYRSLYSFLSASSLRRQLILCQRKNRVDLSQQLNGDYGDFNELVLHAKQAQDYFLVIGPPGTGKTSFGLMHILREQLTQPATNVLLVAYTNRAVDEICSKLESASIDYVRMGNHLSCAEPYRDHLLNNRIGECRHVGEVRRILYEQRVFVGTSASLSAHTELFTLKYFHLAIVDEASQILEPHLLGILSARHGNSEAVGKFVLIGDHKQLPAVVQQSVSESRIDEPVLNAIGLYDCRQSLFERLLRRAFDHGGDTSSQVYMLTHQGRMHPMIAAFSSRHFYHGQLDVVPLPHQQEQDGEPRIRFVPVERPDHTVSDKVNLSEARQIAAIVQEVAKQYGDGFDPEHTVGVIVPYRNQIAAIRQLLPPALSSITIDTVECYQGSQRDVIVYGFTIQRTYQLKFLTANVFTDFDGTRVDRKLNVALTRARRQLYLVGNPRLLSLDPIFRQLLTDTGQPCG